MSWGALLLAVCWWTRFAAGFWGTLCAAVWTVASSPGQLAEGTLQAGIKAVKPVGCVTWHTSTLDLKLVTLRVDYQKGITNKTHESRQGCQKGPSASWGSRAPRASPNTTRNQKRLKKGWSPARTHSSDRQELRCGRLGPHHCTLGAAASPRPQRPGPASLLPSLPARTPWGAHTRGPPPAPSGTSRPSRRRSSSSSWGGGWPTAANGHQRPQPRARRSPPARRPPPPARAPGQRAAPPVPTITLSAGGGATAQARRPCPPRAACWES